MALNVYVLTSDEHQAQKIQVEDYDLVDVLGKKEETLAVKFEELFSSVITALSETLSHKGELIVEVSGSLSLAGEGGAKWLFFNAGGSATKTDTMKITLKTEIEPKK